VTGFQPAGFPHSDISGSRVVCTSPELFAAYHVLHRLHAPRHPPCALSSLTITSAHHKKSVSTAGSFSPSYSWRRSPETFRGDTLPRKLPEGNASRFLTFGILPIRLSKSTACHKLRFRRKLINSVQACGRVQRWPPGPGFTNPGGGEGTRTPVQT